MTATSNGSGGFWGRIVLALLVPVALGLIGYGALKSDVTHVREDLSQKANRETVAAQQDAILRELQAIRADLQDLKRRYP